MEIKRRTILVIRLLMHFTGRRRHLSEKPVIRQLAETQIDLNRSMSALVCYQQSTSQTVSISKKWQLILYDI
jgi:hypothetical protein